MEVRNDDNSLENYFFELVLKKDITKHALKEVYEVLIKENDRYEDAGEKSVNSFNEVLNSYLFGFKTLNGLESNDQDYIGKLFFGNGFPGIEMLDEYLELNVSKNIDNFRNSSMEIQGVVFYIIFSVIENLININDADVPNFLINQNKETVEIDLLYTVEKALKLFEANARGILLSHRNILEKIYGNDFLTDEELTVFHKEILALSDEIIEEFKTNELISESIKKYDQMKENFKKICAMR